MSYNFIRHFCIFAVAQNHLDVDWYVLTCPDQLKQAKTYQTCQVRTLVTTFCSLDLSQAFCGHAVKLHATTTSTNQRTRMQLLRVKAYPTHTLLQLQPTRMQLVHVSHGESEAPTWKERCALDEAQRTLFREGPSRAAELRKSCAAQTQTWKRRKGGRGRRDKKTWTMVNE